MEEGEKVKNQFNRIRTFQPGLVYIFSYKKYKKRNRKLKLKLLGWEKRLNGQAIVSIKGPCIGTLKDNTDVSINWCKCIGREVNKIAR